MGKRQITRGSELATYATIPASGSFQLRHNGHQLTHKAVSDTYPTRRGTRPYTPTRPPGAPLGKNSSGSGTIRGRRTY
ncbi:hypothetical protein SAM23877_4082 [Streptomyces ambofaciens ATCC 23877]|uniref:Uncharacterized protein n=1 Tax=Streptomyces ambofaciens (strain ATCC 23877 / 3486 / DSM 40053 / JCM 4204 / NBRC 12836 / NRRL B-2516) TaxID=278992 RepID=A0A0K2AWE1_STRA7|nr:hypothetical protein SAM23877_4082 [Streptomyces ambofaciens ATCC 23877]